MAQRSAARRIVLIRAVNVGGAKLPMVELREIAVKLGASAVSTYIASGNLLCTPGGDPHVFDRALEAAINQRYGYFREVISRSRDELAAAIAAYPFDASEERLAHIYFLTAPPQHQLAASFVAREFGSDQIEVIGADLHIRYSEGVANTKLTAPVIAKGLGVTGTGRNLRTLGKLLELTS